MYSVLISRAAQRQLDKLDRPVRARIIAFIRILVDNPIPKGAIKLQGQDAYRLRVGDYRVIYTIEKSRLVVNVIRVGHRRDVYR